MATYNHYKRLSCNLPPEVEGGIIEPMNIPPAVLDPSGRTHGRVYSTVLREGSVGSRRAGGTLLSEEKG